MKKNVFICLVILSASLLLTSCATIFGKSTYPVSINTDPSGANIKIANEKGMFVYKGKSPAVVNLKSSAGYLKSVTYNIYLTYPGYQEQTISISSKLNNWYWGNILLGGLVGMLIVDPLTGAMYKLNNAPINVTLEKDSNDTTANRELNIIDIKDVPEDLKEYLVKLN